jgi:hypothetical protein
MRLTIHLHLVTWIGMSGSISLIPLNAFMLWKGTTLHLFMVSVKAVSIVKIT